MWKSKKFIVTVVLTVIVLGGILGGFAVAQADDQESSQPQAAGTSLLKKVAEIYEKNTGVAINADELQKAFTEAGQALKDEALENYLQKLVTDEKITQEQADAFKAWLDARPALPTDEFKAWMDARPDIPGLFGQQDRERIGPFEGMQRGFGKFGGGFGDRFGGWCAPEVETE